MKMKTVTKVRLFVASPRDVQKERDSVAGVVEELNNTIGSKLGFVIEVVRWESHCHPAMGRPQDLINSQIGPYDIFVGIMWKRFGSPTGKADAGTQEEFNLAYDEWKRGSKLHIGFYFSQAKYKCNSVYETEQVAKVLAFKEEIKTKGLVWDHPNATSFPHVLRPHLTTILFEMFQGKTQTQSPSSSVVEKLRAIQSELDKASPHYRLVATSEGEFIVQPKHPEAHKEQPLKVSGRFEFPDTPEGREMRDKLERTMATGEPTTIPKEYIKYLKLPEVFSPLIDISGEGVETVTIGGFVPPRFVPVKMLLKGNDGEETELDYIQLETTHGDVDKIILTNKNQPVPWKFTLTLNLQTGQLKFDYAVNYSGLTAVRELDAMRLTDALSKGGTLEIIHLDTGFTAQVVNIAPGAIDATEPTLLKFIEKAALIQNKTRIPIIIPDRPIEGEEIGVVYGTAQKLETGRAVISVQSWQSYVGLDLAKNLIEIFDKRQPISLSLSFENESVMVFGREIHLGMVVLTCERTTMSDEDLQVLKTAISTNQQGHILARFTPFENTPMLAHYPDWLPPDERDFLLGQMQQTNQEAGAEESL